MSKKGVGSTHVPKELVSLRDRIDSAHLLSKWMTGLANLPSGKLRDALTVEVQLRLQDTDVVVLKAEEYSNLQETILTLQQGEEVPHLLDEDVPDSPPIRTVVPYGPIAWLVGVSAILSLIVGYYFACFQHGLTIGWP